VALKLLRLCARALLHDAAGPSLHASRDEWENINFHCQPLDTIVSDLVAGLYPPQDPTELQELTAALHTICEQIAAEFPGTEAPPAQSEYAEQVQAAQVHLDEVYAALVAALI